MQVSIKRNMKPFLNSLDAIIVQQLKFRYPKSDLKNDTFRFNFIILMTH